MLCRKAVFAACCCRPEMVPELSLKRPRKKNVETEAGVSCGSCLEMIELRAAARSEV